MKANETGASVSVRFKPLSLRRKVLLALDRHHGKSTEELCAELGRKSPDSLVALLRAYQTLKVVAYDEGSRTWRRLRSPMRPKAKAPSKRLLAAIARAERAEARVAELLSMARTAAPGVALAPHTQPAPQEGAHRDE